MSSQLNILCTIHFRLKYIYHNKITIDNDVQFLYRPIFYSKFKICADYEHLPIEKEFSMSVILCCYAQTTMNSFLNRNLSIAAFSFDVAGALAQRSVHLNSLLF